MQGLQLGSHGSWMEIVPAVGMDVGECPPGSHDSAVSIQIVFVVVQSPNQVR